MTTWFVYHLMCSVLLLAILGLAMGCQSAVHDVSQRIVPVALGDQEVQIVVHEAEAPGLTYINMHDNEDTAAEAALAVIRRKGGRLVELQHTGERNITFALGDSTYVFDPNRMFTEKGLAATMRAEGPYSRQAHEVAAALADSLLRAAGVDTLGVVVTVHNNTEGEYSTLSYMDGGAYQNEVLFAYLHDPADPDDFFFVTNQQLYSVLRTAGFNVVLQDNAVMTDDGSLSVYCGQQGIPYVNAEAQHGHYEQQVKMLEFLDVHLPEVNFDAPPVR